MAEAANAPEIRTKADENKELTFSPMNEIAVSSTSHQDVNQVLVNPEDAPTLGTAGQILQIIVVDPPNDR